MSQTTQPRVITIDLPNGITIKGTSPLLREQKRNLIKKLKKEVENRKFTRRAKLSII